MNHRYFQPDQWLGAARNALKPRVLTTMALSISTAVVVYGLFNVDGELTFGTILFHFIGGMAALFSLLFGLTALAHQLHCQLEDEFMPNTIEACRFAWSRAQSILMLPVWGAAILLVLILAEMVVLALANIPGLGVVWLALIGVPLLLLNSVVAIGLVLALFNMAARMAIADTDAASLKSDLWRLIKERLPELLIYNLGGVLVSLFMAVLVLSPLWLGAEITLGLVDYAAHDPLMRTYDATGFWGGIAHLIGLVMFGLLLAAAASVPGVVITQMTLLVHLELASDDLKSTSVEEEGGKAPPKTTRQRAVKKKRQVESRKEDLPGPAEDKPRADG
ncbi:MAG: hypothetical protein K9M17_02560 [Mariprofundaceae bacterium]|nr:hypothetical protein [Mariprofundaceae bacterium]